MRKSFKPTVETLEARDNPTVLGGLLAGQEQVMLQTEQIVRSQLATLQADTAILLQDLTTADPLTINQAQTQVLQDLQVQGIDINNFNAAFTQFNNNLVNGINSLSADERQQFVAFNSAEVQNIANLNVLVQQVDNAAGLALRTAPLT